MYKLFNPSRCLPIPALPSRLSHHSLKPLSLHSFSVRETFRSRLCSREIQSSPSYTPLSDYELPARSFIPYLNTNSTSKTCFLSIKDSHNASPLHALHAPRPRIHSPQPRHDHKPSPSRGKSSPASHPNRRTTQPSPAQHSTAQ